MPQTGQKGPKKHIGTPFCCVPLRTGADVPPLFVNEARPIWFSGIFQGGRDSLSVHFESTSPDGIAEFCTEKAMGTVARYGRRRMGVLPAVGAQSVYRNIHSRKLDTRVRPTSTTRIDGDRPNRHSAIHRSRRRALRTPLVCKLLRLPEDPTGSTGPIPMGLFYTRNPGLNQLRLEEKSRTGRGQRLPSLPPGSARSIASSSLCCAAAIMSCSECHLRSGLAPLPRAVAEKYGFPEPSSISPIWTRYGRPYARRRNWSTPR